MLCFQSPSNYFLLDKIQTRFIYQPVCLDVTSVSLSYIGCTPEEIINIDEWLQSYSTIDVLIDTVVEVVVDSLVDVPDTSQGSSTTTLTQDLASHTLLGGAHSGLYSEDSLFVQSPLKPQRLLVHCALQAQHSVRQHLCRKT